MKNNDEQTIAFNVWIRHIGQRRNADDDVDEAGKRNSHAIRLGDLHCCSHDKMKQIFMERILQTGGGSAFSSMSRMIGLFEAGEPMPSFSIRSLECISVDANVRVAVI